MITFTFFCVCFKKMLNDQLLWPEVQQRFLYICTFYRTFYKLIIGQQKLSCNTCLLAIFPIWKLPRRFTISGVNLISFPFTHAVNYKLFKLFIRSQFYCFTLLPEILNIFSICCWSFMHDCVCSFCFILMVCFTNDTKHLFYHFLSMMCTNNTNRSWSFI